MALEKIPPVEAQVKWDRRHARPARIRWQGHELAVMDVVNQRSELAAYRADRGPRVSYLLRTDVGEASLVFDGRRRRWFIDGLERVA